MKHNCYILLIAFIFILSFSGCTEYLGENPDNRIELAIADDYLATLTGALPEAWHLFTELMTDNYRYYDYSSWNSGTLVSWLKPYYLWSDEYILNLPVGPESAWDNYYHSIYAANVVLEGIDNAEGDEKHYWLGLIATLCWLISLLCIITKLLLTRN